MKLVKTGNKITHFNCRRCGKSRHVKTKRCSSCKYPASKWK